MQVAIASTDAARGEDASVFAATVWDFDEGER
jgi:hypothetical protein